MKEREISLVDLIFEILLKWRMIIVFMVIGGLLLGGYSYMQSAKTIEIQKDQNQVVLSEAETLADLEKKLTVEEKANVKAVLGYADYAEYYNDSLLMQIDANNTPTTELVFRVSAADEKVEAALVRVYEQMFETGISEWLIQGGMDVAEASKVSELIITENEEINQLAQSLIDKAGVIYVTVVHVDEVKCKDLANQVANFVADKKATFEQDYGVHEVTLVSTSYANVVNEEILSNQRLVLQNISNGITYIDKLKTTFSAAQNQYLELLKKGVVVDNKESAETSVPMQVTSTPSISVKYVVLGMVLFAFLYVFYVFVAFVINNKLRANDDFAEMFGIVQLGMISEKDDKKKFLGFVDSWIVALRDRNKRKFTEEESKEITAVAIKMAVKKFDGKEVCFIGCDVKKQTEDICSSIKAILEKEGIIVSVLDNVLYNAEEMEKLTDAKNVVIIEKIGATMYDEVAKELELLKRYNINVLGGVLVE